MLKFYEQNHIPTNQEAVGSNPSGRTRKIQLHFVDILDDKKR